MTVITKERIAKLPTYKHETDDDEKQERNFCDLMIFYFVYL